MLSNTSRQRGAASLAIAVVLLLIITAALFASQRLASSVTLDATASDQRVQSLFLAETGLERATQRFTKGAVCSTLSNETVAVAGTGSFQLQFVGVSHFDGTACSAAVCGTSYCRVRSTGTVIGSSALNARTLEALIIPKSLTAAGTKSLTRTALTGTRQRYTLSNTVTAGTNQLYVLTILWTTSISPNRPGKVTGITYNGATIPAMVQLVTMPVFPGGADAFYAQIYYLKDPPPGTSDVYIEFDDLPAGLAVSGLNADGVDATTPITGYGPFGGGAGTYTTLSNQITPLPANSVAIDVLSRNNGGNATPKACTDPGDATVVVTTIYGTNNAKAAGESAYCGPTSATAFNYNMGYTFPAAGASYAQAVIRPDNTAAGGKRVRLGGSAGVLKWHEVIIPPP